MLAVVYIVTAFCIIFALTMLLVASENREDIWLQVLSYISYALAALTLGYAVYTLVLVLPGAIKRLKEYLLHNRWTSKFMKNYGFRTLIFSTGSLVITVAYGVYNGVIALMRFMPVWYGALAGYYILLACMRGGILLYHGNRYRKKKERTEVIEIKKFRNSGILLIVLITSLSAAILQMVRADAGFHKPGLMIYVAAAYTFTKVSVSIFHFVKAKKQDDYTVAALRNVNVADAAVSILALQTAMFFEFGAELNTALANALTGAAVCLVVLSLGIYMIVKGNKELKKRGEQ